jgi:glutamate-1-semialdehyde 2,1-aminomutase
MPNTGQQLYRRARQRIPGGTQLLSKRPEMFLPEQWPSYYSKASGSAVWDMDGQRYTDMSYSGIGACILGYADSDVDSAVMGAIQCGTMSTLNCPEEVELADLLCSLHPWADMVRYTRCGGEAMALAVRVARARTNRVKVAVCGYHGWHDWYLAANVGSASSLGDHLLPGLEPNGVPAQLSGTTRTFHYNRIEELKAIVQQHGSELAAIVMEPVRNQPPLEGFLEEVREIATRAGAVLILDEITAGWRFCSGGAHLLYGITPDMAVFAKAISNGYPMAAVIGTGSVMQAAQDSFISSTYWTERIGPVSAIATIKKIVDRRVPAHLEKIGQQVQACWKSAGAKTGLRIHVSGFPQLAHFAIDGEHGQAARTLFTQLMLERGFLASNAFYANYAHCAHDVDEYASSVNEAFAEISQAIDEGTLYARLKGPVAHTGFSRLT